jgi:dipeptidyl aminopeptidase/acylaminoacyl peptidase
VVPKSAGKQLPAIVLVHGSGPQDRDGTVGANKPFRDIAWGLASRGVAVLRYDKRTLAHAGKGGGLPKRYTVDDETVNDALSAIELLRKSSEVDPNRIFVVGHSLGAQLAPRIAERDKKVAGCVMLAPFARPIEDVVVEQVAYLGELDGNLTQEEKQSLKTVSAQAARARALRKAGKPTPGAGPEAAIFGIPESYWLDLFRYDAPRAAVRSKKPLLILQGARDYQVTLHDFAIYDAALKGSRHATLVRYDELNHLFIAGTGKSGPSEYATPGHVDGRVIDDIARFVDPPAGRR